MNAYSTHNDVTAWGFVVVERKRTRKKQAEADFIKNPYTTGIAM
jgi:hypothetical protein